MSLLRVKLCFRCNQYVPIHENDYLNKKEVDAFDKAHSGHPRQVVNKEEVANLERWTGNKTA